MKLVIWIIGVVTLLVAVNYNNIKSHIETASEPVKEQHTNTLEKLNPIINAEKTIINESTKMQLKILEQTEKIKKDAFNAEKVKVFVKAKDTKTCMRILKSDVIDNEVTECNRDHYVEVRNDELENFKRDNEL